jgi:hypothetical protein
MDTPLFVMMTTTLFTYEFPFNHPCFFDIAIVAPIFAYLHNPNFMYIFFVLKDNKEKHKHSHAKNV